MAIFGNRRAVFMQKIGLVNMFGIFPNSLSGKVCKFCSGAKFVLGSAIIFLGCWGAVKGLMNFIFK